MGTTNNQSIDEQKLGDNGGAEGAKNSSSASTGNGGGGAGTGGTKRASTRKKPAEKSVGLPDVTEKESVSVPAEPKVVPAKRGRPAGSTTRKRTPAKKAAQVDATHMIVLLQTVTGIVATREGMQMFALSQEEATQIATPLAAIMAKNDTVSNIAGEYADHIALVIACATIFIPKILTYTHIKKETNRIEELTQDGYASEIATDDGADGGQARHSAAVQTHATTFGGTINNVLSPLI